MRQGKLHFLASVLCLYFSSHCVVSAVQINIDGAWSPWSNIQTPCVEKNDPQKLVKCGGGVRKRYRSCTNPTPQGTGDDCVGISSEDFACNEHACQLPGDFLWSPWSDCSVSCGRGMRKRYTMCGTIREKASGASLSSGGSAATTSTSTTSTTSSTSTTTATTTTTTVAKRKKRETAEEELSLFELEYEESCTSNQYNETTESCNTWSKDLCPKPCLSVKCPTFAKCLDTSTDEDPSHSCECQLGTIMKDDGSACIAPPPTTPTPRPIPTMPAAQKVVSNVITRSASTIIIIFLTISLTMFILLRIFDSSRVIHMNMEIALLLAHICLLPSFYGNEEPCRIISILTMFFFMACFMFMFLEAIYMYSIVTWVVHKDGLLSNAQNIILGWGGAFVIILFNMCFEYDKFGGEYHCFLQMDSALLYGIYIPMTTLVILTFAIVEAAGASGYERLEGVDKDQRKAAHIMKSTLLIILPLVFASFVVGSLAEYEQNIYLYSVFTLINGILGGLVFFFHCMANAQVLQILKNLKERLCPGKEKEGE